MHEEAYQGFADMLAYARENGRFDDEAILSGSGIDFGGADVNGTVHAQLPDVNWVVLDLMPAPNVTIVADAADWGTPDVWDFVIATELFEHAERWREIVATMARACRPDTGVFISTCASTGRPPHGSRGEWGVPEGQYYGNVAPDELEAELRKHFGTVHVVYNPNPGDVYAVAW